MLLIALSALGFLLLFCFEIVSLKKKITILKPIIWLLSNGLLISSVIFMALSVYKIILPIWAHYIGWILLPPAVFSKIYSLVIALPIRKTYFTNDSDNKLITTGIYSLVRYPWIYSFLFILIALFLISGSKLLLVAMPVLMALNLLLAFIQDRFIYSEMFAEYGVYRKRTPMLIPTRRSINTFLKGINTYDKEHHKPTKIR